MLIRAPQPSARAGPGFWCMVLPHPPPSLRQNMLFIDFWALIRFSHAHQRQYRVWVDNIAYYEDNSSLHYFIKLYTKFWKSCSHFDEHVYLLWHQVATVSLVSIYKPASANERSTRLIACVSVCPHLAHHVYITFWCVVLDQHAGLSINVKFTLLALFWL